MKFPHGRCECDEGEKRGYRGCCGGEGPAAFVATRRAMEMLLCTRCVLPSDGRAALLVTPADPLDVYVEHDEVGAAIVTLDLSIGLMKSALSKQGMTDAQRASLTQLSDGIQLALNGSMPRGAN